MKLYFPISFLVGVLVVPLQLFAQCNPSAATITGQAEVCTGTLFLYSTPAPTCSCCTSGCTQQVTYSWGITGGTITLGQGTRNIRVIWNSTPGSLTVNITQTITEPDQNQYTLCYTASLNIGPAIPTASVYAGGPTTFCAGSPPLTLSASQGTNYTYQWKVGGATIPGATGQTIQVSTTGAYSVNISRLVGTVTCSLESGQLQVTVVPNPSQPGISTASVDLIPGAKMLTATNCTSPQWFRNGVATVAGSGLQLLAVDQGDYTVSSTVNNCSSISAAVNNSGNPNNFTVSNDIAIGGITTEAQLYALQISQNQFLQTTKYQADAGRPSQTVSSQSSPITTASPTRKDIVVFREVDPMGREAKSNLGFVSPQSSGLPVTNTAATQLAFYQSPNNLVADDTTPSSLTEYELSPLSRPIKQGEVGTDFQPGVAPKTTSYGANVAGTDAIQIYTISGSLPVSSAPYPVGVLAVKVSTSVQGLESQTITTRNGLCIVSRTKVGGVWAETYYIYNDRNRLQFILPPELMKILRQAGNFSPTQTQLDAWAYQSVYDNDGRVVETKGPGAGWDYKVYDSRDRVVLTQDARLRLTNDWNYTKYDALDRPVISGIFHSPSSISRSGMQSQVDALGSGAGYQNITTQAGIVTGTEDSVFPDTYDEPLVISYYDDYSTCAPCGDTNLQFVQETWSDGLHLSEAKYNVLGAKIASNVKILNSSTWLKTVSYYNLNGNLIQVIGTNHLGGRDRISTLMDFSGKVIEVRTTAVGYNSGGISTVRRSFTYDHAGRLEKTLHQINNQPEVVVSKHEYNEIGQTILKRLHSEDNCSTFLQNVDFRYNIRGWMTNMNNLPVDDTDDYFGIELAYNTGIPNAGNQTRKDGMITALSWKEDLSEKRKLYSYTYDNSGQLSSGAYKAGLRTANNPPAYTWAQQPGFYNESNIKYDFNGNITTLNRNAGIFNTTSYTATPIDSLTYDYTTFGGNQLGKVTEGLTTANKDKGFKDGTNSGDDYGYDVNGALIYDKNKGIDSIKYYFNDRVRKVYFGPGSSTPGYYLIYTYDAAGLKLREEYFNASNTVVTTKDYVGGIELVNGQVLQVAFDEGRITAPSGINYIDNKEAGSSAGFTGQNTNVMFDYLNNQTYVLGICQTTSNPGIYPIATTEGDSFPVKAGESYTFQVLGYQQTGTTANLYVKTNLGDLVWPGGTLPIGSANENWTTVNFTVPSGATWIQVGVRWSVPAVSNKFYINRLALYKTDLEYNYFLTDQVGSSRAVLQTRPSTLVFMATMETYNLAEEGPKWSNLDPTRFVVAPAANSTPGGSRAFRLNNTFRIGPARSFKVFPGDVLNANVIAYFSGTSGYTATTATTMASALSGVLSSGNAAIDGGISAAYNATGNPLIALGGFAGSTFPSGYLNYILFDENYVPIKAKSFPVQNLPSTKHTVQFDQPLEVKELGYLFVYLSYDNNNSNNYLYFDDLRVVVDESPLIQVNNYYPFGLVATTWLREGEIQNAKLFQGKELIAQTGWHDFGSRMYWADLGRWFSTDPQKQFSSPYLGMGNVPMMGRDPNGEFFLVDDILIGMAVGALIGGTVNVIIKASQGKIKNWGDGLAAFGIGAVAGAVGAATGGAAFLGVTGTATLGAGGFAAGFVSGALGSAASMPILSGGNTLYFNDPVMTPEEFGIGILTGGVLGGAINGGAALFKGKSFWNGGDLGKPTPIPSNTGPSVAESSKEIKLPNAEVKRATIPSNSGEVPASNGPPSATLEGATELPQNVRLNTSDASKFTYAGRGRAPEFPSGVLTEDNAMSAAQKFLGPNYKEVTPGRFVSSDGLRQVRFGAHEIANELHIHFEAFNFSYWSGGWLIENGVALIVKVP